MYHRRINPTLAAEGPGGLRRARRLSLPRGGSTRLSTASRGVAVTVPGGRAITHTPTRGTREGVTRSREARWVMARQSFGQFEAERMTADDEGDDSSRLLSRQGPDLQDGGASSETRDHIFASRDENPDSWPPAAPGAERHLRAEAPRKEAPACSVLHLFTRSAMRLHVPRVQTQNRPPQCAPGTRGVQGAH